LGKEKMDIGVQTEVDENIVDGNVVFLKYYVPMVYEKVANSKCIQTLNFKRNTTLYSIDYVLGYLLLSGEIWLVKCCSYDECLRHIKTHQYEFWYIFDTSVDVVFRKIYPFKGMSFEAVNSSKFKDGLEIKYVD
jgi:hypothetical protein